MKYTFILLTHTATKERIVIVYEFPGDIEDLKTAILDYIELFYNDYVISSYIYIDNLLRSISYHSYFNSNTLSVNNIKKLNTLKYDLLYDFMEESEMSLEPFNKIFLDLGYHVNGVY